MPPPLTAEEIWRLEVPQRGQAATVRGELLRAVEKLRDEAQRNGNLNWSEDHAALLSFLKKHLSEASPSVLPDLNRLSDHDHPTTEDEPYDRLVDAVVTWAATEASPAAHEPNPRLGI